VIIPKRKIKNKIMFRILVDVSDSPSKIKLKAIDNITPDSCPPKSNIPDAVAYPTGKVVWVAKSVSVLNNGYMDKPVNAPPTYPMN
jgi:hypothetical protein